MNLLRVSLGFMALTVGTLCKAQDYCGLLQRTGAVGFRPLSGAVDVILAEISEVAAIDSSSFRLQAARDPNLRQQGAASQICNGNQRWIFYDPDFAESIRKENRNDRPKYFTFAHELAHHVNNDTLEHHRDEELNADAAAANWLTRRGASMEDIASAITVLVKNEDRRQGYPTRCERLSGVVGAYNQVAREYGAHGATNMPLYEVTGCVLVRVASSSTAPKMTVPARVTDDADLRNKVKRLVAEQLGIEISQADETAHLVEDLGSDQLDLVELIMAIEDAFSIEISDEDAAKLVTVGDVINYLNRRLSADKR